MINSYSVSSLDGAVVGRMRKSPHELILIHHQFNVMYFFCQMVATEDTSSTVPGQIESPGTFGKLRQTLSSSLLTAQDKGNLTKDLNRLLERLCCETLKLSAQMYIYT